MNSKLIFIALGQPPEEYCSTMLWKQKPDGTKTENDEKYYLLSDVLPKDKQIREDIEKKAMEKVLSRHQFERIDKNFLRGCLYCRSGIEPTRYQFVEHLYTKHFLQLGKPENLVFIDELIDFIEDKLTNLICVYCEKVFKDRSTLKEHMRKKGHKRINPENKAYDRFFMCNYKMKEDQMKTQDRKFYYPRATRRKQTEEPSLFNSDDSDDWADWEETDQQVEINCLFCSHKTTEFDALKVHMSENHKLDFDEETENLSFYQKVKFVNFVRRKIHLKQCLNCEVSCETVEELITHMTSLKHIHCEIKDFDKPEFFFPTFEDDSFLCHLDIFNEQDEMSDDSGAIVISEDRIAIVNEAAEMLSREKFIDL